MASVISEETREKYNRVPCVMVNRSLETGLAHLSAEAIKAFQIAKKRFLYNYDDTIPEFKDVENEEEREELQMYFQQFTAGAFTGFESRSNMKSGGGNGGTTTQLQNKFVKNNLGSTDDFKALKKECGNDMNKVREKVEEMLGAKEASRDAFMSQ